MPNCGNGILNAVIYKYVQYELYYAYLGTIYFEQRAKVVIVTTLSVFFECYAFCFIILEINPTATFRSSSILVTTKLTSSFFPGSRLS